ncbi:hypothetical protein [Pajaroellobacter abortibovis]|uniref:hypothetical protein n=1 Tax=Pajaroellobacter abortibovis TaxID=1882918 RepID=UPI0012EB5673|nr:hypothetical protein [Pajaroellobacter abortibovis]
MNPNDHTLIADINSTQEALRTREQHIFHRLVRLERQQLIGYISGLQVYNQTWYLGFLGARPSRRAGHATS